MKTFSYRGEIVDKTTKLPVTNVRVELLDVYRRTDAPLAVRPVDAQGKFTFELTDDWIRKTFGDGDAVGYFRVVVNGSNAAAASTERTRRWTLRSDSAGRIEVDASRPLATLAAPSYVVEGLVVNTAGPVASAAVTLKWKEFRANDVLLSVSSATATTDAAGRFRVVVSASVPVNPSFEITATASSLTGTVTVSNAKPTEYVEIVLGDVVNAATPSRTTAHRINEAIQEATGATTASAINAFASTNVNTYIAARGGLVEREVAAYIDAAKLQTQLAALNTVDLDALFALAASGIAATKDAVFTHRLPVLHRIIQRASESRRIRSLTNTEWTTLKTNLEAQAIAAVRQSPTATTYRVGNLVDSITGVGTAPAPQNTFLSLLLNHEGTNEAFWTAVNASGSLTATAKSRFQLAIELANACNWHQATITSVVAEINAGTTSTLAHLAAKTAAQWQVHIGTPPAGTTLADFASLIELQLAKRAFTAHIKARATSNPEAAFFTANPNFDFDAKRFSRYLAENLGGAADVPTKARLSAMDRLFRLTETWAEMSALLNAGVTSARDVVRMGRTALAALPGLSTKADIIFRKATWTAGAAVAIASKWKGMSAITSPVFTDQTTSAPTLDSKIGDWATLFGSLDQCVCEHCQSVLSPSAYLVDTLELLKKVPASSGSNAQAVLLGRRPDVAKLALTCEHATTPVPAIDLVNEILEVRLSSTWPTVGTVNTTAKAEDLAAHPEVLFPLEYAQAYTSLDTAVFPFEAPWNVWQSEARIYLEHLGAPRDRLIADLAAGNGVIAVHLVLERLRISQNAYNLLTAGTEPASPHLHWGLASSGFTTNVANVRIFMNQTGLTFDEVRELTTTGTPALTITPSNTCNLDAMSITEISAAAPLPARHRLNQFLRLRAALRFQGIDITISDLGRVVAALVPTPPTGALFDASTLQEIAALHALTQRLGVSHVVAASWYADMDRNDAWNPSLFTRTFLSRSTFAPAYDGLLAVKTSGSSSLPYVDPVTGVANAGLLAGLEISAYDLGLLVNADAASRELGLPASAVNGTSGMTLVGVSLLARIATFSRAVGLSIRDLVAFARLTDSATGAGIIHGLLRNAKPTDTLKFLDLLDRLRRVELTAPVADYVIRHVATQESGLEPSTETIADWETTLAEAVRKAVEETRTLTDDDATDSATTAVGTFWALGRQLLNTTELDNLNSIVKGTDLTFSEATTFINLHAGVLGDAASCVSAIATGGPTPPLPTDALRRGFVTRRLARYLKARSAVISGTAELLSLPAAIVAKMWGSIDTTASPLATRDGVMGLVIDGWVPTGLESDPKYATPPTATQAARRDQLLRLHQAAYVLKATKHEPAELAAPSVGYSTLRTTRLADATTNVSAEFEALIQEHERAWLRDRWGKTDVNGPLALTAYATGGGATVDGAASLVADQNSFQKTDVLALFNRFSASGTAVVSEVHTIRMLMRVFGAMELLRRVGASAPQAIDWVDVRTTPPQTSPIDLNLPTSSALVQARAIKAVARAKHDAASWATVGRSLRDPLREQQRRLLAVAVMNLVGVKTLNDLYDNLLIDVEMGSCVLTSRMVAAHASVQAFVQRIQLNLESPAVAPNTLLSRRWDWMSAYRVWEANRKVFLWPENWLDPELRTDTTELFTALESALRKGPLDDVTAGNAYRTYLDGLAEIANLEVVAMCRDGLTLHLFGRTTTPYRYFYRTYRLGVFTPWQRVELAIQGESLLPIVNNGTLYLFWMRVDERATKDSVTKMKTASSHTAAEQELAVFITCAERRNGTWSVVAADTSGVGLVAEEDPSRLLLTASSTSTAIELRVSTHWTFEAQPSLNSAFVTLAAGALDLASNKLRLLPTKATLANAVVGTSEGTPKYQAYETASDGKVYAIMKDTSQASFVVTLPRVGRIALERPHEPADSGRFLWAGNEDVSYLFVGKVARPTTLPSVSPRSTQSNAESLHIVTVSPTLAPPKVVGFTPVPMHHNFVNEFRGRVARWGIKGLLSPRDLPAGTTGSQSLSQTRSYTVGASVDPIPNDVVDFTAGSAFGEYNWELFFHAPFLIANRLSQEGKYAEARRWYHYIFDPTDGAAVPGTSAATRYWKFLPFAENKSLADIQSELTGLGTSQYGKDVYGWAMNAHTQNLMNQIQRWRDDPFNPHAIAKGRILAYQKATVMRYIDNLIAWGDALFRQDTRETLNEAMQLYILALRVLGAKPVISRKVTAPTTDSYSTLGSIDAFGNAIADVETVTPAAPDEWTTDVTVGESEAEPDVGNIIGSLKFCVPENESLLRKWDIVADRLFKIRHCQNIDGVERQLPLFEPPIDPALLVRARAAGLDLSSVMFDLQVSAPPYRYVILMARAMEYASAITGLGASLLSALEKQDGEELARLRTGHELANLGWTRDIRKEQRDEAKKQVESATQAIAVAEARKAYYAARPFMNDAEAGAQDKLRSAEQNFEAASLLNAYAAGVRALPEIATGFASAFAMIGGQALAAVYSITGQQEEAAAGRKTRAASQLATQGGYERRQDDWTFQAAQAELELVQLDKQLLAAEIRLAVAEHELLLVEQQLAQSAEVEQYYRSKFTNKELYGWMAGELSVVFSESYRIAFEMARHAERAFQRERGDTSQSFIKFGAWDGTRQGLLAGEKLASDLRRMDSAYHTQNTREHEIMKTISIAQLNPAEFLKLREGKWSPAPTSYECAFSLPEALFDEDYPTHHMRRIKSVSVTLQAAAGPYQSVSGRLSLQQSSLRRGPTSDPTVEPGPITSMVTSGGVNDSGLFELNFRDERYLPFEYRGVQSDWKFTLSGGNEFPYDSITDLVFQVRYTAREGRKSGSAAALTPRSVLLRLPHSHPDAWTAFKETGAPITFQTTSKSFPAGKARTLGTVSNVAVYARHPTVPSITLATPAVAWTGSWSSFESNPGFHRAVLTPATAPSAASSITWTLSSAQFATITDLWVAFDYSLT
ncbi:MAG: neuraminidase-like domain-containing protein [Polyangiaceae bacterium]